MVTLQISDRYALVTPSQMALAPQPVLFPALSIPVERKDEFNCPSSHVDWLKKLLPEVTKVITIGWRATEMDFLELLRGEVASTTPLMVISDSKEGAEQTRTNLRQASLGEKAVVIESGFSGLILEDLGKLDVFLRKEEVARELAVLPELIAGGKTVDPESR